MERQYCYLETAGKMNAVAYDTGMKIDLQLEAHFVISGIHEFFLYNPGAGFDLLERRILHERWGAGALLCSEAYWSLEETKISGLDKRAAGQLGKMFGAAGLFGKARVSRSKGTMRDHGRRSLTTAIEHAKKKAVGLIRDSRV